MAETITIICPTCEKSIKAPESVVGKKIRCKGCGETFTAKAPKAPKEKPGKEKEGKPGKKSDAIKVAGDEEEGEGAYGLTHEYLGARCAECAEAMGEDDVICLNCGYNTITRLRSRPKKVKEQTGGDVFLWLLPGILCVIAALFLLTWLTGNLIFRATRTDLAQYDKLTVNIADCCLLWFSIFQIWLIYKSTRFAINRLIRNPSPPEIEEKFEE
jgi:DNA-directed RNA polymerase subunit RPC12/RpoP